MKRSEYQRQMLRKLQVLRQLPSRSICAEDAGIFTRNMFDTALVRYQGRPQKYPIEVDASFVFFLVARQVCTAFFYKTTKEMKLQYRKMLYENRFRQRADTRSNRALKRHVYYMLKKKRWHFVTPKTLDLKR